MQALILNNQENILTLCGKHHVKELHVFGSALREDLGEERDVDFLVEFKPYDKVIDYVDNIDELSSVLRGLLQRNVDLIQYSPLTNKYLKNFINQEKVLLYAEA